MSLDVEIGELQLVLEGVDYPEHRVAAISREAVAMLEELIQQDLMQLRLAAGEQRLRAITAPAVTSDFSHTTDAQLSRLVAQAIYSALVLQLRV